MFIWTRIFVRVVTKRQPWLTEQTPSTFSFFWRQGLSLSLVSSSWGDGLASELWGASFLCHSSTWLSSLSSLFTSFSSPPPSHSRKAVPRCARFCIPGSGNRAPQYLTAPHILLQCPVNNYACVWVIMYPTSLPRASTNAHSGKKQPNRKLVKDQEPEGVGDESFRKYQLSNN